MSEEFRSVNKKLVRFSSSAQVPDNDKFKHLLDEIQKSRSVSSYKIAQSIYHAAQLEDDDLKGTHSSLSNAAKFMTPWAPESVNMELYDSVSPKRPKMGEIPLRSKGSINSATTSQDPFPGFAMHYGLVEASSLSGISFEEQTETLFSPFNNEDAYEQVDREEKRLRAQLEAVRKEKRETYKQMCKKINQTKCLVALEKELAGKSKEREQQMKAAGDGLIKLEKQWASIQYSLQENN